MDVNRGKKFSRKLRKNWSNSHLISFAHVTARIRSNVLRITPDTLHHKRLR